MITVGMVMNSFLDGQSVLITKGTIVHHEKSLRRMRDLIVDIILIAIIIIDHIAKNLRHVVVLVAVMKDIQGIELEVFLDELLVHKQYYPYSFKYISKFE